jgi:lipid-A-disaccharide synthase
MTDAWRTALYLPLGLIPSLFFTLRILIQWWQSERAKKSSVTPLFWKLSMIGQITLFAHFVIQVQYPFALIQATNTLFSWRNLNLMGSSKRRISFYSMLALLVFIPLCVTGLFLAQSTFLIGEIDWIRTPTKLWDPARTHHALVWHCIGTLGGCLFASRFWVQWWLAEKQGISRLSPFFWWISLLGSLILLLYFVHIQDTINIINYSFGIVPYVRNLMLLRSLKLP